MIYLRLFVEFFKTGLFAVGGGYATIPFLLEMSRTTGWFSKTDLSNMLAISESTPGPIGINMSTFTGFHVGGFLGAVVSTFALVLPSFIIIVIIAQFLKKFRDNKYVDYGFNGIRPGVSALITFAVYQIVIITAVPTVNGKPTFNFLSSILILVFLLAMQFKPVKKIHPVALILFGAVLGIVFKL